MSPSSFFVNENQCHLDQDQIAIRVVGRVLDQIKKLQAVVLQFKTIKGDHKAIQMHELAHSLFGETFEALNHALCVMKSRPEIHDGTGSPPHSGHGSPVSFDSDQKIVSKFKRRRVVDYSWTNFTSMPHDDGYIWRKYGEKNINGSDFPRAYFRCTYKYEQNCEATKLVQQKNNNDPPLFEVKYANKHTCYSLKQIFAPSPSSLQANPGISVENYNCINQITTMQNCNRMMSQMSMNQALVSNEANLREMASGASMVPSCSEWDMDSLLMEFGGFEQDDWLLLPSLKSV